MYSFSFFFFLDDSQDVTDFTLLAVSKVLEKLVYQRLAYEPQDPNAIIKVLNEELFLCLFGLNPTSYQFTSKSLASSVLV